MVQQRLNSFPVVMKEKLSRLGDDREKDGRRDGQTVQSRLKPDNTAARGGRHNYFEETKDKHKKSLKLKRGQ